MIQIMDVKKSFGTEEVLHGITREFEPGKIHGIVGNNGSGKTVLMKCICGFLRPTSGRILVDGKEVGKDMDFPENLGAIIETPGFLPNLTGLKNLKLLASLRGKIGEEQIRSSLRRVGLDPDLKKTVSKYSLGMRQRLGIAQAIMEDPFLLILDEPTTGVDARSTKILYDMLYEINTKYNTTIFMITHGRLQECKGCDRILRMDEGRIVEE